MQRPIAAEKLFVPGFRPADKLVWNGNAFEVAPAGQLAYMTHPETGRRMMVAEPTAVKLVPFNSSFIGNDWSGQPFIEPVQSLLPGGQAVVFTPSTSSNALYKTVGVHTGGPQTCMTILRKHEGAEGVPMLAVQDLTSGGTPRVRYDWSTDQLTPLPAGGIEITSFGRIRLSPDIVFVWMTIINPVAGGVRRPLLYADNSSSNNPVEIHYLDIEETPYWTSPIVTGSTALTRAADVLRIDDYDQKVIGDNPAGTIHAECVYPSGRLVGDVQSETEDNSLSNSTLLYSPTAAPDTVRLYAQRAGGVHVAQSAPIPSVDGIVVKVSGMLSDSEIMVAIQGVAVANPYTQQLPAGINRFTIAARGVAVISPLWITKITRDHIVRTAAQLEEMTS